MNGLQIDCDVLVVGSGGAGFAAALAAADLGATVELVERSSKLGGTTAVSGGIVWIPAHDRDPSLDLPVPAALEYLAAVSNGTIDPEMAETYVRTAPAMLDFVERVSPVRFSVAEGFPDYKPEKPGGRPEGGRSLGPLPFSPDALGGWADRIRAFPKDWSNVGFDAETRARLTINQGDFAEETRTAGTSLIAGLLQGLLDLGVTPRLEWRAVELIVEDGAVRGARMGTPEGERIVRARRAVILANGGFEWNPRMVGNFLRGPMNAPVSPPGNVGDGLTMAMSVGAELGNMREAWWTSVVQIPGDTIEGEVRTRSFRVERTRPRSIMVNRLGKRFVNEAADYNSMAGAFHYLDPARFEYVNNPAWLIVDKGHLDRYRFFGSQPGEDVPEWFLTASDLDGLSAVTGIDRDGLAQTVAEWNVDVASGVDSRFNRGASAYDGFYGDTSAPTLADRTLGPIDQPPYYAVPVQVGALGTRGGPRTDRNGQVLHLSGQLIDGLYAAGNVMASIMGMAYPGAGATIGTGMVWGFRAGHHAATGTEFVPA